MKSSRTLQIRKSSKQLSARSKSMVLGELSRLSRPCSPQDQEKPLKAGWLKRQRSIMKNWQLRWFVLRSEALYFYKDQEESKAQGCIPLQGSQVNEVSAHQDEPGRHLFEIVPGGTGEKDRSNTGHESFLLMANSQSDMEEWVRAIRRAIWAPLGGGVFGQHLQATMSYESQCGPQREVPVLVELCASFIREQGLKEEGLFRAPGQTNHVRELQDVFDRGEIPVFDSSTDVHTVASLLKLYIRELPEPIIPFSKYSQFLSCAQLLSKDKETAITELSKQVKSLPQVNYNLLKYICKFLDEVQLQSNDNKMSVQNLATVFGPNILRPRVEDPVTMMEGSSQVQHLMTILISEHSRLYPNEDSKTEVKSLPPQHELKRSKVEWVSQEETNPPNTTSVNSTNLKENHIPSSVLMDSELPTSNPLACEKDENSQTKGNDVNKLNEKADEKENIKTEGESEVAVSPSKQAKALPSWRCSFKGNVVSGGSKGKMGGSAGDVSASGGSNWLMNGLSSLRAHRRTTSSGERVKDSTLSLKDSTQSLKETTLQLKDTQRDYDLESPQTSHSHRVLHKSHRLSAYDNVAPSSLSLPADTSSIWTPFEISLSDTEGSNKSTKLEQDEERNTEVGNRTNDEEGAGIIEEIPNKLTQLKQELKKQKVNYETRIRKLEESCSKYQCQVSRLEEDLDQERKKCHLLEIRLRNSERAHQDAENRNVLLQREMEEFFKTFGELTTGAARTN
ncbi:rho GTPase-activating protein 22 isoform X1 [Poecilia reticulata]|uniref:rho GTPase-activating protein 22 isoform X1 n=1 Tax=Poecilia reticulata TaxID=8081 RepID=UPI0004A3524F|nr:PREDICTED: rho GTPase-activating protein 22 isoform X1 [Poecilia reticulata]XP_008427943.1 PREDICTED: rho GTPase-activating protein 22 isoform X1 [Poecilia reticulata]